MSVNTPPAADYDSPWKVALARYLPDAFALFFPEVHTQIDWSRGYTLLDLDWQRHQEELVESVNPFATVVLAHLAAQQTRGDIQDRGRAKLALTRRLYERGYGRQDVLELYRFIDWLLQLEPAELCSLDTHTDAQLGW